MKYGHVRHDAKLGFIDLRKKRKPSRLDNIILALCIFLPLCGVVYLSSLSYQSSIDDKEFSSANIIPIVRGYDIVKPKPVAFKFNSGATDLNSSVQYGGAKLVTAYKSQVEEMANRGYSKTRILDILATKSMECNQYNGDCKGYLRDKNWKLIYPLTIVDYGPMQINRVHSKQFAESMKFRAKSDWEGLFKYQLTYANNLISSYEGNNCSWENAERFKLKGESVNERRYKCVYIHYNGSKNKNYYAGMAWEKRKIISEWLVNNSNFLTYGE